MAGDGLAVKPLSLGVTKISKCGAGHLLPIYQRDSLPTNEYEQKTKIKKHHHCPRVARLVWPN